MEDLVLKLLPLKEMLPGFDDSRDLKQEDGEDAVDELQLGILLTLLEMTLGIV